ncbi:MAG: Cys-tRNA(Pro) deacylase [Gammaproteobacteria bacterium]|nr:Cys-tRNA(Pro) deacylase [Gammaproteobacteria bacterium]MBL6999269.1 Cys-tRNA(Pro) deacylase [Gammaproteobacteria bacterium]
MTPAINVALKAAIPHRVHQYAHDASAASYGLEAAEKLGIAPQQVFKTLVLWLEPKNFAVALIPVGSQLSMKRLAKAAGAKKAAMAERQDVERVTGYVLGGVSPLGQKTRLKTLIDQSAAGFSTIYVSAGRRGLEIELAPQDLQQLTAAQFAELCQQ